MVESGELLTDYGAFPADPALQQSYFDTVQKQYPDSKIDWTVPQPMLGYVDKPNHQALAAELPEGPFRAEGRVQQVPDHRRRRHRCRTRDPEDDPAGHLRRARHQPVGPPPGVPRAVPTAREASLLTPARTEPGPT